MFPKGNKTKTYDVNMIFHRALEFPNTKKRKFHVVKSSLLEKLNLKLQKLKCDIYFYFNNGSPRAMFDIALKVLLQSQKFTLMLVGAKAEEFSLIIWAAIK